MTSLSSTARKGRAAGRSCGPRWPCRRSPAGLFASSTFAAVASDPAEDVAARACAELQTWIEADVPVAEHLADQLLIPMALAAREGRGSVFVSTPPSLHTRTNAEIIARFLPVCFDFEELDERRTRVRAGPSSD